MSSQSAKVTFHVYLPSFAHSHYIDGYPIIVGNIEELGSWENPIVKLKQKKIEPEDLMYAGYWYSDPISIPNVRFNDEVNYSYAFFIPEQKNEKYERDEKNVLSRFNFMSYKNGGDKKKKNKENQDNKDNKTDSKMDSKTDKNKGFYLEDVEQLRLLTMRSGFQFDIVRKFLVNEQLYEIRPIKDFVFVDLIYKSIASNNLEKKVMEFQDLLNRFGDIALKDEDFIASSIQNSKTKKYEKRIFLCFLLGHYIQNRSVGRYTLPSTFPTAQIIDALEKLGKSPEILPSECYNILNVTMTAVITHLNRNKSFDWLRLFEVASIIDPNFTFIEAIRDLNFSNSGLTNNFLKEFTKSAKPIINQIKDFEIYSNIGRVSHIIY